MNQNSKLPFGTRGGTDNTYEDDDPDHADDGDTMVLMNMMTI